MIRLIASDLDDTLLNQHSQVSPETKAMVQAVMAKGVTFTLATGRMFQASAPFAKELGLAQEQPIICYNGALIKRVSGETIYEKNLSTKLAAQIVKYAQGKGWTVNAYYNDELYVAEINQYVREYAESVQVEAHAVGDLVEFILADAKGLSKLLIVSEPSETIPRLKELKAILGKKVHMVSSRDKFIEITNAEAHKGAALMWLAEQMGLKASEVLALGDSNNDLTMLKMAGVGVAVANALDSVKQVADEQTATNYEHGVAQAIEKYVLNANA